MLLRCYKKEGSKYSSYKECSVDFKWHNFQNYAKWFEENYVEGFAVDKDILIKGNKIYSPETCVFVPAEINTIFGRNKAKRGKYPLGVNFRKDTKKYNAQLNIHGKRVGLGTFDTIEEAFQAYKVAKENEIKRVANKYRDQIIEECYWALINYKVEITD